MIDLESTLASFDEQLLRFGATLLQGLVERAAMSKQLLVVEPQSKELEAYFAALGFRHVQESTFVKAYKVLSRS